MGYLESLGEGDGLSPKREDRGLVTACQDADCWHPLECWLLL